MGFLYKHPLCEFVFVFAETSVHLFVWITISIPYHEVSWVHESRTDKAISLWNINLTLSRGVGHFHFSHGPTVGILYLWEQIVKCSSNAPLPHHRGALEGLQMNEWCMAVKTFFMSIFSVLRVYTIERKVNCSSVKVTQIIRLPNDNLFQSNFSAWSNCKAILGKISDWTI